MSDIIKVCCKYSMISVERFMNNIDSIKHVCKNNVEGDIVEIGVWKGGSMLSMILQYETFNENIRDFHLYDTFSGMTPSTNHDIDLHGTSANTIMSNNNPFIRCISPYDEVLSNITKHIKYDLNKIHFHVGDILLNNFYPEKIAVLRLDTDWYESTKFELEHFYDKVSKNGVIIIDDYGHWKGCKKAVDEFLILHPEIKLNKIDYTGVYFYKP
jgi:O-methyltransferase